MPAPSAVFTSISTPKHTRVSMGFTHTWGQGDVFEWYSERRGPSEDSVLLAKLQIRIDDTGIVPHRFVVALMKDDSTIRFDRRPETGKLGTLLNETLRMAEYRKACDESHGLDKDEFSRLKAETQCEIEIELPDGTDLLLVPSAAFAMANDKEIRNYSLTAYNYFFFSWTIIMIVARHAIPFILPPPKRVLDLLNPRIEGASSDLVKKMADLVLSLVLDTIATFQTQTGRSLYNGLRLSKRGLMIRGLPKSTVQFLIKGCLKVRLTSGLEEHPRRLVTDLLRKLIGPLLADFLISQGPADDNLKDQLWFDHLKSAFDPLARRQLLKIFWSVVPEALVPLIDELNSKVLFGDIKTDHQVSLLFRLKHRILGPNGVQYTRVWNEALHDALSAVGKILDEEIGALSDPALASDSLDNERRIHRRMVEGALKATSSAALEATKRVVGETIPKDQERVKMWQPVWGVWTDLWDSVQAKAEKSCINLMTDIMSKTVDLVVMDVVRAVGNLNDGRRPVQAVAHRKQSQKQVDNLSSLPAIQEIIAKHIRSAADPRTQTEVHIGNIQDAMTRAWIISRTTYKPWHEIRPLR